MSKKNKNVCTLINDESEHETNFQRKIEGPHIDFPKSATLSCDLEIIYIGVWKCQEVTSDFKNTFGQIIDGLRVDSAEDAYSASDKVWQDRCSAVHAQKAIYSHVLFVVIYRNCEIGIQLVSRVQIPVEASLEKFLTSKIKICPQQTACKSGTGISPTKLTVELLNLTILSALKCTGNLRD